MPPLTQQASGLQLPGVVTIGGSANGVPDIFDSGVIGAVTMSLVDTIYMAPYLNVYRGMSNKFRIRITNAAAATKLRAGIWAANRSNGQLGAAFPGQLIATTDDILPVVSDNLDLPFTVSVSLNLNWYWLGIICDDAIVLDGMNQTNNKKGYAILGNIPSAGGVINAGLLSTQIGWTSLVNNPGITGGLTNTPPRFRVCFTG